MLYEKEFKSPQKTQQILARLEELTEKTGSIRLMEICGTHTMSIARTGIKSILPASIRLLSGPGCPVCVTPANVIDSILSLAEDPHILIASYGDLLRVPGTDPEENLLLKKAKGAHVEMVYSPMDALELSYAYPQLDVLFLGVGFETTAPGTAACILKAAEEQVKNFSVLSLLKKTEPALRSLITAEDFAVDGFLCPGHVAAVTGSDAFAFLPREFHLPAVVSGFDAADLLYSILELTHMLAVHRPALVNTYTRLVRPEGNPLAQEYINAVFQTCESTWRGLGTIVDSGYTLRDQYRQWDAWEKFHFRPSSNAEHPGCRCAQVIRGVASPLDCPLFKTVCSPAHPIGPCMVSSEGACAAAYQYEV